MNINDIGIRDIGTNDTSVETRQRGHKRGYNKVKAW